MTDNRDIAEVRQSALSPAAAATFFALEATRFGQPRNPPSTSERTPLRRRGGQGGGASRAIPCREATPPRGASKFTQIVAADETNGLARGATSSAPPAPFSNIRVLGCQPNFRLLLLCLILCTAAISLAQVPFPAPPVTPKTPDVKLPEPLALRTAVAEAGKKPLTVQEAVQIALRLNPTIKSAQGLLQSSQGREQQTASGLHPQFTGSGGFNDQRILNGPNGSPGNRFSLSAGIDQLLYDFGRTRDEVRQQQALERASRQTLNSTLQSVTLQTKQAYYNLAQSLANAALSESDVKNRKRQLDEAEARFSAGIGAPTDLLQAKTNLADASISLVGARESVLTSQVNLAQALGIDPRTPLILADSKETPTDPNQEVDALVKKALGARPDILLAREQLAAAHFGLSAARKANLPVFTVSTGLNGAGPNDPVFTRSLVYGLNVSWTFDDGGFAAGLIKSARGAEETSRDNLQSLTLQAINEVSTALLDLRAAVQRETLAEVGVANAQEFVRISEGRYEGGIGQFLDVTNSQNSLVSAQRSLTQAQGDIQRAQARLKAAIGQTE